MHPRQRHGCNSSKHPGGYREIRPRNFYIYGSNRSMGWSCYYTCHCPSLPRYENFPYSLLQKLIFIPGDKWLLGLDCCHARDEKSSDGAGESRKQNIKLFKEHFKDFAPAIQKLLSYVQEAYVWKIIETTPPSWISESGRVVLIGDAAHAILPFVGQVSSPVELFTQEVHIHLGRRYGTRGCCHSSRMSRAS
jgi:hypothetical protein